MLFTTPPPPEPLIAIVEQIKEPEKKEQIYTIKAGDNLTKIAEAQGTTVARLWAKNTELTNPDLIEPDKPLKIPQDDEVLTERPMPVTIPSGNLVPGQRNSGTAVTGGSSLPRGSSAGNTYSPGYCTFGVKEWRPDLPNNLGDAYQWFDRAAAQGMAVGYTPAVGAVGVTKAYSHVVLIIGVSGDTVTVKEMNYGGLWKVSTRTAPITEFRYIY